MFIFRLRRALAHLEQAWLDDLVQAVGKGTTAAEYHEEHLAKQIAALDQRLNNGLYYYLAMCDAIPADEDDAAELAYCVYSLYRYGHYNNDVLIEHASFLAATTLFRESSAPRLLVALRDNELNISISPLEVLTLLSRIPHVSRRFDRFAPAYKRAYEWVKLTQKDGLFRDKTAPAWMAEPWRGEGKPEAWLNAAVIDFLLAYRRLLRHVCAEKVLIEFRAVTTQPKHLWQADIPEFQGFKAELQAGVLEMVKRRAPEQKLEKSSMILFGPPGTTKTSIAKAIAWELKWPFVEIGPHLFAEEGIDSVIRRARAVFQKLMVLDRCVVLLDEIDELVSNREKEFEKIGRFITTSVLPWLQHIRDRAEVILIVATNYVRNFDVAVKRPGRFDYVIPIGPPGDKERRELLRKFLVKGGRQEAEAKALADQIGVAISEATVPNVATRDAVENGVPVRADDRTEADGEPEHWAATIGELQYLAEHVLRDGREWTDEAIKRLVGKAAVNPLIDGRACKQFRRDSAHYRYPPVLAID